MFDISDGGLLVTAYSGTEPQRTPEENSTVATSGLETPVPCSSTEGFDERCNADTPSEQWKPNSITAVHIYATERASPELLEVLDVAGLSVQAVAVSPDGAWVVVAGAAAGGSIKARIHRNRLGQGLAGEKWPLMEEVTVASDFNTTGAVVLAMDGNRLVVGAGSVISSYSLSTSLRWTLEDELSPAYLGPAGYTLALEGPLLVIGSGAKVTLLTGDGTRWAEAFSLTLPAAAGITEASPPAQVAVSGLDIVIGLVDAGALSRTFTFIDSQEAFPGGELLSATSPGDADPVRLMLKMTGLQMADLTDERQRFLKEGIANISLSDESHVDRVSFELNEFWGQIFAKVAVTVPEGYDRLDVGWDLFDGIRFGGLNRVLIAKDPFFATVQLSAASFDEFNPFAIPPEPTDTPEPTYPPSPLIQVPRTGAGPLPAHPLTPHVRRRRNTQIHPQARTSVLPIRAPRHRA